LSDERLDREGKPEKDLVRSRPVTGVIPFQEDGSRMIAAERAHKTYD